MRVFLINLTNLLSIVTVSLTFCACSDDSSITPSNQSLNTEVLTNLSSQEINDWMQQDGLVVLKTLERLQDNPYLESLNQFIELTDDTDSILVERVGREIAESIRSRFFDNSNDYYYSLSGSYYYYDNQWGTLEYIWDEIVGTYHYDQENGRFIKMGDGNSIKFIYPTIDNETTDVFEIMDLTSQPPNTYILYQNQYQGGMPTSISAELSIDSEVGLAYQVDYIYNLLDIPTLITSNTGLDSISLNQTYSSDLTGVRISESLLNNDSRVLKTSLTASEQLTYDQTYQLYLGNKTPSSLDLNDLVFEYNFARTDINCKINSSRQLRNEFNAREGSATNSELGNILNENIDVIVEYDDYLTLGNTSLNYNRFNEVELILNHEDDSKVALVDILSFGLINPHDQFEQFLR